MEYKEFLSILLTYIEPRREGPGETIIKEEDEYLEIIFFCEGIYQVGYTIKAREILVVPFKCNDHGSAIGAYGVTYQQKA